MSRNIPTRSETIYANELHTEINDIDSRILIIKKEDHYLFFWINNNRLRMVKALPCETRIGSIILARVLNVKNDINAAFVKLDENTDAFLKMSNVPDKYMPLHQGDIIPVKIIADEQKGKRVSVSAMIHSRKLPENWKYLSAYTVIGDNKKTLSNQLISWFNTCNITKIVTDNEDVYSQLSESNIKTNLKCELSLYKDEKFALSSLYSLKTKLEEATASKVYLKSGAYLVINKTEALTIVDVNSGKNTVSKKTDSEENIYKINLEAAKECFLQMQLRNISGMILIDFINMKNKENEENLIREMEKIIQDDIVKCQVVDITPLGIMEITRQKADKPLSEIYYLLKI